MSKSRIPFEPRLKQAIRAFWSGREQAAEKQQAAGMTDQGNRGKVTGGKTMDSFRDMIVDVARTSGPPGTVVHRERALVGLPGFFRPTQLWDLLVLHDGRLLAALELKSLCGPSLGNNANNRCEEALGGAFDFRKSQSEGLLGAGAAPFVGYLILVGDGLGSEKPVKDRSPHFPTDPAFNGASYQRRMQLLCERMVQHQLYACASVLVCPNSIASGARRHVRCHTGPKTTSTFDILETSSVPLPVFALCLSTVTSRNLHPAACVGKVLTIVRPPARPTWRPARPVDNRSSAPPSNP